MIPILVLTVLLIQPREAALEGEWVVDVVDNIKVMPDSQVTITFSGTRVMGQASCNSYTGTYRATADAIKFEGILTTMRACDDSRMSQERDFLGLLRATTSYEIGSGGTLVLRSSAGKAITARRRAK
jgi:putative lipoprotein